MDALTKHFDTSPIQELERIHHMKRVYGAEAFDYDILTGNICVYSLERLIEIQSKLKQNIYTAYHAPLQNGYDPLDDMTVPLIDSVNRYWDPEHEANLWARIIPNKHPVISFEREGFAPGTQDLFIARPFESTFGDFTVEENTASLMLIAQHYMRLINNTDLNIDEIAIFQNYGSASARSREDSGETQPHPCVQIWGFPFVAPRQIRQIVVRDQWSSHIKDKERNIFDIALEMARERNTVVYENESFLVYAPPAPRTNYTVRIISTNERICVDENAPRTGSFPEIINALATLPAYTTQLALAFGAAMRTIKYGLGNPAYNMLMHTIKTDPRELLARLHPAHSPDPYNQPIDRFFIDIHPRIRSAKAGMEQLTEIDVIGATPEVTTQTLRSAL